MHLLSLLSPLAGDLVVAYSPCSPSGSPNCSPSARSRSSRCPGRRVRDDGRERARASRRGAAVVVEGNLSDPQPARTRGCRGARLRGQGALSGDGGPTCLTFPLREAALNVGRRVADEVSHAARLDDDAVEASAFERADIVGACGRQSSAIASFPAGTSGRRSSTCSSASRHRRQAPRAQRSRVELLQRGLEVFLVVDSEGELAGSRRTRLTNSASEPPDPPPRRGDKHRLS